MLGIQKKKKKCPHVRYKRTQNLKIVAQSHCELDPLLSFETKPLHNGESYSVNFKLDSDF